MGRLAFPAMALALLLAAGAATAVAAVPSDPSAAGQQPLSIMRVGEALDHVGPQLADIPVLVSDTGLDLDHVDIAPRLFALPADTPAPDPDNTGNPGTVHAGAPGWDLIGTGDPAALQPDADPSDSAASGGHGALVAGLLGAAWNNGAGGAGVAPNARFVALRTCWGDDQCYQYVQASAFNWAADRGARVVSMSWLQGPPYEADFTAAIAWHPNVLFVAIPSGNGGACDADGAPGGASTCGDVDFDHPPMPCAMKVANVLCVSTASPTDALDCGAYGVQSVDVAVPTENSTTTSRDGGFTGTGCATSFAAPEAAGIATILFGIDPSASSSDVRAAIVDSARKAPAWDGKSVSGGIVDAVAAVDLFQSRRGIAGRTPPVAQPPTPPAQEPPPTPAAPDRTPPVVTIAISPISFRAGGPALGISRKRGARLRIGLSENAKVRITFAAIHAKKAAGSFVGRFDQGTTRLTFPGTAHHRRLRPGRYRVVASATDYSGNSSRKVSAVFKILRG